jgi:hypothetical protein
MNAFERLVRAAVIQSLRDTAQAPTPSELAAILDASEFSVVEALRSLADAHRLAFLPITESVWMAHPFSAVPSDFVVTIGERTWFANCVWDGLSIIALLGDGSLDTHSPATGRAITLVVCDGAVLGDALVHFLVPARRFWDDIGFT